MAYKKYIELGIRNIRAGEFLKRPMLFLCALRFGGGDLEFFLAWTCATGRADEQMGVGDSVAEHLQICAISCTNTGMLEGNGRQARLVNNGR
jgi:hypothetical protein